MCTQPKTDAFLTILSSKRIIAFRRPLVFGVDLAKTVSYLACDCMQLRLCMLADFSNAILFYVPAM